MKLSTKFLLSLLSVFINHTIYAQYDILLVNGQVIDGTGKEAFQADIGIKGDRIVAIGANLAVEGVENIIDANGKVVAPGFIDIHSHAYEQSPEIKSDNIVVRQARNLISQGITTVVVNQDGSQPIQLEFSFKILGTMPIEDQAELLNEYGIGPNVAPLVGYNFTRYAAMPRTDLKRPASEEEREKIRKKFNSAMEAGAWGISVGLEYYPAIWADTEEVIDVVKVAKPYDGVFIVHERASGADPMWYWPSRFRLYGVPPTSMEDNIKELIEIAKATGLKTSATHIKLRGKDYWGKSAVIEELFEEAWANGVNNLYLDLYPYNTTGSDGEAVLLPDWVYDMDNLNPFDQIEILPRDYTELLEESLEKKGTIEALKKDVLREVERRGGMKNIVVLDHKNKLLIGKTIAEIANMWCIGLVDVIIRLQKEGYSDKKGGGVFRGFSLDEQDVIHFLQMPNRITCSDAGIADINDDGKLHPRFFGNFPKLISDYVLDTAVLTLPQAIRTCTSLPAEFMGFKDRGIIKEGFHADLIVIDLEKIEDFATAANPRQYSTGIDEVIINGVRTIKNGEFTEELPGKVLLKNSIDN